MFELDQTNYLYEVYMETILQVRVEEAVLRDAEEVARFSNSTITELFSDFVSHLARQANRSEYCNEINNYKELVASLQLGREQYLAGEVITHEEMIEFLDKLPRECNVSY